MLVFKEGGKPEDPEQNPRSKDENNQLNLEVHGPFVPTVISHPVVLQPNTVDLYPIWVGSHPNLTAGRSVSKPLTDSYIYSKYFTR